MQGHARMSLRHLEKRPDHLRPSQVSERGKGSQGEENRVDDGTFLAGGGILSDGIGMGGGKRPPPKNREIIRLARRTVSQKGSTQRQHKKNIIRPVLKIAPWVRGTWGGRRVTLVSRQPECESSCAFKMECQIRAKENRLQL